MKKPAFAIVVITMAILTALASCDPESPQEYAVVYRVTSDGCNNLRHFLPR